MTNIYVGNLDFTTPEDQLRALFAAYGAVETVTIVMDRDTLTSTSHLDQCKSARLIRALPLSRTRVTYQ